jgi:hypothetical protein
MTPEPVQNETNEWETECPARSDRKHCEHWYDGEPCCDCQPEAARQAKRTPAEVTQELADQRAMTRSILGGR